jgi:hypothetical protein
LPHQKKHHEYQISSCFVWTPFKEEHILHSKFIVSALNESDKMSCVKSALKVTAPIYRVNGRCHSYIPPNVAISGAEGGASAFMGWLVLPVLPCPLIAFASRKVAVSGERTLRFEFDLDKKRRPDCKGTATGTSAALSFRFAEKPRGLSRFAGVLVPAL